LFEFIRKEVRWSHAVPLELAGEGRFVIPRNEFVPAYVKTYEEGRLREKVGEVLELLRSCHVCPRDCEVNRLENKTGVCKSGRRARVTSAFTHFGEEDCLRGWNGSGTIFFAWCNLRCVFCQNFETSQQGDGIEVTAPQLAAIMLRLQSAGCHNINFVTPEHVVPQILEALLIAINGGLRLPLVYNTSSYDSMDSIRLMDGVVDIYMPDFKLWIRNAVLDDFFRRVSRRCTPVLKAMRPGAGGLMRNGRRVAAYRTPPGDARSARGHRRDRALARQRVVARHVLERDGPVLSGMESEDRREVFQHQPRDSRERV
jgi:hypothetical protein